MSTSPYFAKAFLGTNGRPAASGWFYAYAAGSTVPKAIFADASNTVPLANPLRLDGNGICPQYFTEAGLYDFKVFEYNFVTPDAPGPSCFTAEDIDGETGGGGSTYVLPIATETTLGGVKPDGATTFVDEDGVLTAPAGAPYELPTATTITLGGVKPDGVTVQVDPGGVLSVIPEELTPELAGYSEGGYTEFTWINQYGSVLGQSSIQHGTNLFRIQDFIDGMVLKFRWIARLDSMNTTQTCYVEGLIGGEAMGQFDITPPSNGDYNVVYEATVYLSSTGVSTAYLGIQSKVDFSKNGSAPAATLYSHTRYWSTGAIPSASSVALGMIVTRAVAGGYQQQAFQAWMENAQRSSTLDPALIFQPLEDQRLSTDRSVAFATATARSVRVDTAVPDTTAVIGSTFWDDTNKTIATHVANGSTLQHGQEVVFYVRNVSGFPISNGSAVYITGANGQKCTVALAAAADVTKSSVLAIATQNIPNNSDGYATTIGRVNDIDTSAFAEGAELWLSDVLGGLTSVMPSGNATRVHIGHVIRSHATQGSISVMIERYPFASELSGSGITTRTTTSATASGTNITRYTGTGGDTEALPAATAPGQPRYYKNSGTGLWTLQRAGADVIEENSPSATSTSLVLLPGQMAKIHVAQAGRWVVLDPSPRRLVWDDLQLLGSARNGVSAPTLTAYRGIDQWEFSASTTNQLSGSIELPHTYSEGTDIVPHAHFTTASTSAAGGGVVLGIEYTICNPVDGATEAAPVTLTATKTIPAVNSQYKQFSIDLGTISGAGLKVSALIRYRIFRLGGDGADTFPATIFPQSFALHYRSDSDGSTAQNSKY